MERGKKVKCAAGGLHRSLSNFPEAYLSNLLEAMPNHFDCKITSTSPFLSYFVFNTHKHTHSLSIFNTHTNTHSHTHTHTVSFSFAFSNSNTFAHTLTHDLTHIL
jgi:hypothetical protein